MDPENISVEIRPRSPLEAIDLGFAMARQWFFPLWILWITGAGSVFILSYIFFSIHLPAIIFPLIWWLKPVYEKPLVYWLSRALFHEQPGYKWIVKQYFKIIRPKLFADLTYLRFRTNRSFFMPVTILENLRAEEYSNRIKILGHNQGAGKGLTFISFVFETVIAFSMAAMVTFILPDDLRMTSFRAFIAGNGNIEAFVLNLTNFAAMSIMAPFYVAAGFSLYINRRTKLEAWDIEISFKRLMARKAKEKKRFTGKVKKRAKKTVSIVLGLLVFLSGSFMPFSNEVQAGNDHIISKKEAASVIENILSHEDFGRKETKSAWKIKEFEKVDYDLPEWLENLFKLLGKILILFGNVTKPAGIILEIAAWALGGMLFLFIIYKIGQHRQWFKFQARVSHRKADIPSRLFGLDLSQNTLPDNIVDNVLKLLNQDEIRKALSLLYRGTLVRLINDFNLTIPASATENECLKIIESKQKKNEVIFFKTLTNIWLAMAYGHIIPQRKVIEKVCMTWKTIYGK